MLASLAARLAFAASMGLGIDESYMVAAGRAFRLGYVDHPPAAWWLAWAAAQLAGTDGAFVVRLPFIALFSLSTWLMYQLAATMFGPRAGFWAVVLLNLTPVLAVTAGAWVLPDGPLIAAMLGATLCLVRALPAHGPAAWRWWLGVGGGFGLALCSKYTAVLPAAGVGLYLLSQPTHRRWLLRPQPYVAALLAALLFAPVLAWNVRHGFVSFLFQGGRATGDSWHLLGPLATLGGEALFFLPWIFVPLLLCLARAVRRGPAASSGWLLACLSLPSLVVFAAISLRGHVLFHWAAPAAMLGLPLLGAGVAHHIATSRWLRRMVLATALLVPLGMLVVGSNARFNWLPNVLPAFGLGHDPGMALVDWTDLRNQLAARRLLGHGLVVAGTRWNDTGKVDYALHGAAPVICLGYDPRQYGLTRPASDYRGADMIIVAPRYSLADITERFGDSFAAITALPPVLLHHAGKPAMLLPVFLGHRFK